METERPTKPCAVCGGECADQWRLRDEAGRYFHRPCYENGGGPPTKPCAVCGWECANRSRLRDERGRYFHQRCYEKAKLRKLAKREASKARKREAAEARELEAAGAREREADEACELEAAEACAPEVAEAKTIVAAAQADRVPKLLDDPVVGGAEYAKPVVLVVAGVSTLVMTLRAGAQDFDVTRDAANVVDSLTVLTVCAVLGAVVIQLAARAMRGGAGPRTLIFLRVAGIYAVAAAVALISVVTVSGDLGRMGLIVASVCAYGLTGWLFRLDFAQVVGLVILAIGLSSMVWIGLAVATAG